MVISEPHFSGVLRKAFPAALRSPARSGRKAGLMLASFRRPSQHRRPEIVIAALRLELEPASEQLESLVLPLRVGVRQAFHFGLLSGCAEGNPNRAWPAHRIFSGKLRPDDLGRV